MLQSTARVRLFWHAPFSFLPARSLERAQRGFRAQQVASRPSIQSERSARERPNTGDRN